MKRIAILLFVLVILSSCRERKAPTASVVKDPAETASPGGILIARDIVTDVIIRPDPDGDPWEMEKVKGFNGSVMVNSIFDRIYDGSMMVYDYHSGEPLTSRDVRDFEKEFNNDRSKIGKLSFTEDWYYNPVTTDIEKITKSVVFGYELYNNQGKVYAYRAAFQVNLHE